jgi:hypothetical protein
MKLKETTISLAKRVVIEVGGRAQDQQGVGQPLVDRATSGGIPRLEQRRRSPI